MSATRRFPLVSSMARPETERLFLDGEDVPAVHVPSSTAPPPPPDLGTMSSANPAEQPDYISADTLDESLWATIMRDVVSIYRNLQCVLIPVKGRFHQQSGALRNWDLWGPLIFLLTLCITLSADQKDPEQKSSVFSLVFVEVGVGACILTLNVLLLGGNMVFFQSLCLLGYCLFPMVVAAIICYFVTNSIARCVVLIVCLGWASAATLPFISQSVPNERKGLAVYPVLLMYASLGWIALVS